MELGKEKAEFLEKWEAEVAEQWTKWELAEQKKHDSSAELFRERAQGNAAPGGTAPTVDNPWAFISSIDLDAFFAQMANQYETGANREESALAAMRAQMATTKAGMVAFQLQMQAEEAEDARKASEAGQSGAQVPGEGQQTIISNTGAVVTRTIVSSVGSALEEHMLAELKGVSAAVKAKAAATTVGDGMATD